jgi:hypothetical protein
MRARADAFKMRNHAFTHHQYGNDCLVSERSDEINQCYDEYYPIHQSTLHDIKFLELLIQCGADTNVRTSTQGASHTHQQFPCPI